MKSFEKQTVSLTSNELDRSVSLNMYRRGDGEGLVLFLHGLAGSGAAFEGSANVFPSSEWTIVIPDLPGHGASGSEPWYPYSPAWYGDVLLALQSELNRDPAMVVGHSMGGTIGLLLCERLTVDPMLLNVEGLPESLSFLERRVRRYGDLDGQDGLRRVREEFQNVDDPGIRTWLTWTERCHPDAFFRSARRFVELWETSDMMERFRDYPSDRRFYVCGSNGQLDYVKQQLPEEAFGVVQEAGHFPMVTQPEAFWSLIRGVTDR